MPALLIDEEISCSVYPIETIIAEKLHAIVVRGDANSRSKDILDLVIFMPKADKKNLQMAIDKCFSYRKTDLPKNISSILKKMNTTVLEKGWVSATTSLVSAPKFKVMFGQLIKQLEDYDKFVSSN